jgi:hypothetical protein
MLSDLIDTNAVESTSAQPRLRLLPATKPKLLIVEDSDDSRDVPMRRPIVHRDGSLPIIDSLKAIRRIQKNEAQAWGLTRSRAARR